MMIDLGVWDWLGLGLVLLFLEVVISGVFLFWVGLAALTVALILLVLPSLTWQWQLLCFGLATLGYVLSWSYFGRSRLSGKPQDDAINLNSRTINYVGQIRPLSEAIIGGKGAITIDDSRWVVNGEDLPEGTLVKITEVRGANLIVIASSNSSTTRKGRGKSWQSSVGSNQQLATSN